MNLYLVGRNFHLHNEDEISVGRQDILQFFSGEFKDYKYVKFPQTLGAL